MPDRRKGVILMSTIYEQIKKTQEQIEQLNNKKKRLISQQKNDERKKRTKRLIERGAILESVIENAADFTNEQIQALLIDVFSNAETKAKIENLRRTNGNESNPVGRTYTP